MVRGSVYVWVSGLWVTGHWVTACCGQIMIAVFHCPIIIKRYSSSLQVLSECAESCNKGDTFFATQCMRDVVMHCSITSSADAVNAGPPSPRVNVSLHGGASLNVVGGQGPAVNVGSLPDLLSANIQPPLVTPLDDVSDDSVMTTASLPTYDMAIASSNRYTQQQQQLSTAAAMMTLQQQQQSQPHVLTTDSSAKTGLLAGGNTIVLVPQVYIASPYMW